MLKLCNDETNDYGKLYISYPMVEAIKHLKDMLILKIPLRNQKKSTKVP